MSSNYDKYVQYSRTKLLNMQYAFHLAAKHGALGIECMCLEPGVIQTKLLR